MNERNKLIRQIHALDFSLLELNEYLDTHPSDMKALKMLEIYRAKRQECIQMYESRFGPYVQTVDDVRGDRWTWIDNPWPWDYQKGEC